MYFEAAKSDETPIEPDGVLKQPALHADANVSPRAEASELENPELENPESENPESEVTESEDTEPEADLLAGCPDALRPALLRRGFEKLTPVQQAIADADDGHRDLRISSQTGSGKTVALGFALLDGLIDPDRRGPTTLVIAPTRELAMQVKEELGWLFADVRDVACEVVTGGTSLERERTRLRRRPNVVVGTPGRLLDHLRRGVLDVSSVRQLVLDEADQMLDLGFKDELDGILENLPEDRRTHLVSATFPRAVLDLANRFQSQPLEIQGSVRGEAHDDIEHIACRIGSREHYQSVVNLLLMAGDDRTLVFVRTREDTARMADKLAADGFAALPINGDLAQAQRTRTLNSFRNGTVRTLIATDVAARGLDIPSVTMVIHVELPIDSATYVHRSGRTGRAGQKGRSVLLVPKSRASRTQRLYRELRLDPRWTSAPSAAMVEARQLERAEASAMAAIDSAPVATPTKRALAANLLRERDPIEVVAVLLSQSMSTTRAPFDLLPSSVPDHEPTKSFSKTAAKPAARHPAPTASRAPSAAPDATAEPARRSPALGSRLGQPGAVPSWRRPESARSSPNAAEQGFTRFRINWGTRDGADPRRILAHVCRRADVDSRSIGSIELDLTSSTFDVKNSVAEQFAQRVRERDKRDPHLFIQLADDRSPMPQPAALHSTPNDHTAHRAGPARGKAPYAKGSHSKPPYGKPAYPKPQHPKPQHPKPQHPKPQRGAIRTRQSR